MTTLSPDTVRRIEDAAAALIGGGSLSNISPVMRAFRACQREQADDDIARADQKRDEALAKVATLESELAVLREVVAERDRLLQDTKAELKKSREDGRKLQAELLALTRHDGKVKK